MNECKCDGRAIRQRVLESGTSWRGFLLDHPIRGFLASNLVLGRIGSFILPMTLLVVSILWLGPDFLHSHIVPYIILLGAIFYVLGYFMCERPLKAYTLQRNALNNAFIIRHREDAAILGFEKVTEQPQQ